MKSIFAFVLLLPAVSVLAQAAPSRALLPSEPIEQCLDVTKAWSYRNVGGTPAQAARHAMDFCAAGGRTACLDSAQQWIYRNVGGSPAAAALQALQFCRRGDLACLEPTRVWISRNTGVGPAQAARQAIGVCADRLTCSP